MFYDVIAAKTTPGDIVELNALAVGQRNLQLCQ